MPQKSKKTKKTVKTAKSLDSSTAPKTEAKLQKDKGGHGNILMNWTFPLYEEYERGTRWYVMAALIGLGLLIWALVTANFLFAIIIVMFAVIFYLQIIQKPDKVKFTITEEGLEMGSKFYPYKDINKFWLIYEPPEVKSLYFNFKSALKPRLSIPLQNMNPLKARETLLNFLEEDLEQENEPTSDALGRLLKL